MKTEVYSWRLSRELKADLEREARGRNMPVSTILDEAVREWLTKSAIDAEAEDGQRRLQAAAARCIGVLAGGNPRRAETAREAIRERLRQRRDH
jgi:predicted transcriptional regulator